MLWKRWESEAATIKVKGSLEEEEAETISRTKESEWDFQ